MRAFNGPNFGLSFVLSPMPSPVPPCRVGEAASGIVADVLRQLQLVSGGRSTATPYFLITSADIETWPTNHGACDAPRAQAGRGNVSSPRPRSIIAHQLIKCSA